MARHLAAPRVLAITCSVAVVAACTGAATRQSTASPNPVVFGYELTAPPESALVAARFALGTVDGSIQLPQIRPSYTTVSTHYTRDRRGGGQRQVAIIIAVDRASTRRDSVSVTAIELRAFALDMAQQVTPGPRRTPMPQTALSTNAPALRTPRPITPVDTLDWHALQLVAQSLEARGARRIP